MKVAAIIVCAGIGKRLGKIDKAVLKLEGKPLFYHTFRVFQSLKEITQIVIVLKKKNFPLARKLIRDPRVVLVAGGKQRKDSVFNGLGVLNRAVKYVLIHDGARPLVSPGLVRHLIDELKRHPAVICGAKAKDTVKLISKTRVKKTLDRRNIFLSHTPQGFRKDLIVDGYKKFKNKTAFDDAEIVEQLGVPVKVIADKRLNPKITYPQDVQIAKLIMESDKKYYVGLGFDLHRFSRRKKGIVLGAVKIPFRMGIEAVSDGDVVLHAVSDGICGASGLGDIGDYFPPSAKKSRGIKSTKILETIVAKLKGKFDIINVDVTVITEKPRLSSYKAKIVRSLKKLLPGTQVNLGVKSKEGLEILGGTEAISCLASVLVKTT